MKLLQTFYTNHFADIYSHLSWIKTYLEEELLDLKVGARLILK